MSKFGWGYCVFFTEDGSFWIPRWLRHDRLIPQSQSAYESVIGVNCVSYHAFSGSVNCILSVSKVNNVSFPLKLSGVVPKIYEFVSRPKFSRVDISMWYEGFGTLQQILSLVSMLREFWCKMLQHFGELTALIYTDLIWPHYRVEIHVP